jgi:hypothetical protein
MRTMIVLGVSVLALVISPVVASAEYILSLSNAIAHPGDRNVYVYAQVNDAVGTVSGFDFTITYNPAALELYNSNVSAGSLLGPGTLIPTDSSGINGNDMPAGVFAFTGFNYQSSTVPSGMLGKIVDMKFHVLDSASGPYTIAIWPGPGAPPGAPGSGYTPDLFNNDYLGLIPLTLQDGSITVNPVPEPSSLALLASFAGVTSLVVLARRQLLHR